MRCFRVYILHSDSKIYVAFIFFLWPLICIKENSKLNNESENRYMDDFQADTASSLEKTTNGNHRSGYLSVLSIGPWECTLIMITTLLFIMMISSNCVSMSYQKMAWIKLKNSFFDFGHDTFSIRISFTQNRFQRAIRIWIYHQISWHDSNSCRTTFSLSRWLVVQFFKRKKKLI